VVNLSGWGRIRGCMHVIGLTLCGDVMYILILFPVELIL